MAFPFKKVLAPIDFHDHAMGALEVAKNIAQANDGALILLYVVPMDEPIGGHMYEEDFKKQAEKDAVRLAELAAERLKGIKYDVLTEIGDPATAIINTAGKKAADVIVMGTHGRKRLMRVLMGSVAEEVLREAPCPVIVYRLEKKA
ncbi:MAG: universal stress protein [Candidatus Binataceae bacterium]|jgi:universal stress protein A